MGERKGHGKDKDSVGARVERNVAAIAEVERTVRRARTAPDLMVDAVVRVVGNSWFIVIQAIWIAAWIAWNLDPRRAFDGYPFTILGLIVSLEAIMITMFVLASQNRMTAADNRREHLNLQISLLAEAEMTKALKILQRISAHLGMPDITQDPETNELAGRTDILEVARHVDKHLGPGTAAEIEEFDETLPEPAPSPKHHRRSS